MVYVPHLRVTASGRRGAEEEWSTGFRMLARGSLGGIPVVTAGALSDAAEAIIEPVTAAFRAFHVGGATAQMGTMTYLDRVTITPIGVNGRKLPDAVTAIGEGSEFSLPAGGPNALTAQTPFQCATVLSLRTDVPQGPAAKGRMYAPVAASVAINTGQMPEAFSQDLLDRGVTLINACNAADPDPGAASVEVAIFADNLLASYKTVVGLRCGRVPDTVRRRRNHLAEQYLSAPLVP